MRKIKRYMSDEAPSHRGLPDEEKVRIMRDSLSRYSADLIRIKCDSWDYAVKNGFDYALQSYNDGRMHAKDSLIQEITQALID